MSPRRRCQVPGCTYPSVSDLPVAPDGLPSLSEVAAASLRGCCRDHLAVVSNTYAAAVDWALLGDRAVGGPPTRQAVQEICDGSGRWTPTAPDPSTGSWNVPPASSESAAGRGPSAPEHAHGHRLCVVMVDTTLTALQLSPSSAR